MDEMNEMWKNSDSLTDSTPMDDMTRVQRDTPTTRYLRTTRFHVKPINI